MEQFGGAHTYMPTHSHTTHTQFPGLLAWGDLMSSVKFQDHFIQIWSRESPVLILGNRTLPPNPSPTGSEKLDSWCKYILHGKRCINDMECPFQVDTG
jgi:hypothetical protein